MSQPPIISICVANYNGMDVIDDCLKSVMTQSGGLAVEIIVHDDASSDRSVTHIREHYPDVKLIESEKNVGFCIANNRMAAIARGEYLLLLNNDATLFTDALITLHKNAQEAAQPTILGLPQHNADTRILIDNGSLLDPFLNPIPNKVIEHRKVGMIMGACLWIPKDLWNELEGFPELFGSIGEDLYLCCRARLTGYTVQALGKSGYYHKVGMSFGGGKVQKGRLTTTQRRRSLSERNKSYVMFLCYPAPALYFILPLHLLLLMLEGILLGLAKRDMGLLRKIYTPVLVALWREHSKLFTLRHKCQEARSCSLASWLTVFRPLPYKLEMLIKHGLPKIQ
ncbi:MAG: glycosyltransferase [Candidatus Sedimenticola sp. (ex Thyasira tokunagai)]